MDFKLDHLNLTVANINETKQWYSELFGMELVEKGINPDGLKWAILAKNDSMLCISEYPKRKLASEQGVSDYHRIYHFGIRISDERDWLEKIEKYKLQLFFGGVNEYPHSRSWYIKDPSGYTIEVSHSEGPELQFPPLKEPET